MPLSTDPIDIAIDPATGDIIIPPRPSAGVAAAVQQARICLLACKGEWFLDLDNGVPYLERDGVTAQEALLGQRFDRNKTMAIFRTALARATLLTQIVSLEVSFDATTRVLAVSWSARTSFGDLVRDELEMEA